MRALGMLIEWVGANSFAVKSLFLSLFFAIGAALLAFMAFRFWKDGAPLLGPISWAGCAGFVAIWSTLFFRMFLDALRGH